MSCPTVTAMVMSGGCSRCDQHGCCSIEALVLKEQRAKLNLITVAQACEVYAANARAKNSHKAQLVALVRNALAWVGRDYAATTFADLANGNVFDDIVAYMRRESYADSTIETALASFRALDGKRLRQRYFASGYTLHSPIDIDIQKYELTRPEVQKVGLREVGKIRREMAVLAKSSSAKDRATFLYLFLYLECSMSKRDIIDARWSLFKQGFDGKYFNYRRHKTGKSAGDILAPDAWLQIEDMAGDDDDYIVQDGTRGRKGRALDTVSRRANKICRDCGIVGNKASHALRKHGAQILRAFGGIQAAASRLGDTLDVTNRNYAGETSRLGIMGVG